MASPPLLPGAHAFPHALAVHAAPRLGVEFVKRPGDGKIKGLAFIKARGAARGVPAALLPAASPRPLRRRLRAPIGSQLVPLSPTSSPNPSPLAPLRSPRTPTATGLRSSIQRCPAPLAAASGRHGAMVECRPRGCCQCGCRRPAAHVCAPWMPPCVSVCQPRAAVSRPWASSARRHPHSKGQAWVGARARSVLPPVERGPRDRQRYWMG